MNLFKKLRGNPGQLHIGIMSVLFAFFVLLIVSFILIVRQMIVYDGTDINKQVLISDGWVYEANGTDFDGEDVDLSRLKLPSDSYRGFTIKRDVTASQVESGDLCLTSKGIEFEVFANDNLIYTYRPSHLKLFGKSEGFKTHVISLLNEYKDMTLRILYVPVYKSSRCLIQGIMIDSGADYITRLINDNISIFSVCLLAFILGFILCMYGLFRWNTSLKHVEFLSIGIFNMGLALWIAIETGFLGYITGNASACHFANYLILSFIAYPPLVYVSCIIGKRNSLFVRIGGYLCFFNAFIQILSTLLGFLDYHELLFMTHGVLFYCIAGSVYYLVHGIKSGILLYLRKSVIVLFFATVVCAIGDLILYVVNQSARLGTISFRLFLMAFAVLLAMLEVRSILKLSHKGERMDDMEYKAYHDGLTNLYNRQAYFREEARLKKEIVADDKLSYMFIQFDVNNLKTMNDTYGHDSGDALISGAAIIIQQTFGQDGKVFRMGGDEFLALRPCYISEDVEGIIKEFNHLVDMFNESSGLPLALSIAYGIALYWPGHEGYCNTVEDAYKMSDANMYDMKVDMKLHNKEAGDEIR